MLSRGLVRDEDYIPVAQNAKRFERVKQYALNLAKKNNGKLDHITERPRCEIGAIAIRFPGEISFGEGDISMDDFKHAISECDGFNIMGTGLADGSFILTFYVDRVHIHKNEKDIKEITIVPPIE